MSKKIFYYLLLLIVTFFWGVTFPLIKVSLSYIDPVPFLAIRFGLSTVLFLPFVIGNKNLFKKENVVVGIIAGSYLAAGYVFQTIGLLYTTAAASGLITGLYVIILPGLSVIYLKLPLSRVIVVSSVMAFAGLIIMSSGSFFSGSLAWLGDVMTLVCAFSYAFQLAYLAKYSPRTDAYVLSFYQLLITAIITILMVPVFPHSNFVLKPYVIFTIIFTAIFAGILAIYVMTRAMAFVEPSLAGIIFVGEPVFAAISSVFLTTEIITLYTVIGGVIMVSAIFLVTYSKYREDRKDSKGVHA